jgi:hypothetical protein
VGGDRFSVVWCQRVGLTHLPGASGKFSQQCYFEGRLSGSENFLTRGGERNKGNTLYEQIQGRKKGNIVKYVVKK